MTAKKSPNIFAIMPWRNPDQLPLPSNGPYYVASRGGYMAHLNFHFGRVLVPVKDIPSLPEPDAKGYLWSEFDPKLPTELIAQAWSFFRAIWESKKSEAMVDITWSAQKGYRLFVPSQTNTMGGVDAKRNTAAMHGLHVGTIHSHCNFNAFHSDTDTHDADEHDGLHITIGHVDRESGPSVAAMLSHSKIKWDINPDDAFDMPLEPIDHPKWWEKFVNRPSTAPTPTQRGIVPWKPAPTSPIVTATYQPTKLNNDTPRGFAYESVAEMVWHEEKRLTEKNLDDLQTIEENLDIIQSAFEKMDIDFDYTMERYKSERTLTENNRRYQEITESQWEAYMEAHAYD